MAFSLDVAIYMDAQLTEARSARQATGLSEYINLWLGQAAKLTQTEMEGRAPVGVAGSIGEGIAHNINADVNLVDHTATIGPDLKRVPYAGYVETGTKPHMPPVDPNGALAQWCEMKGLSLWPVALSIAKKGTQAHPYVQPTYQAIKAPVMALFERGVSTFIRETNAL